MRFLKNSRNLIVLVGIILASVAFRAPKSHEPQENELTKTITQLDDVFFTAYNSCDLETQAKLIAEDLEFYHDQGGLNTSKEELLAALEKNICGKVRRELVEGSIEVSEIPGYGPVQIGMHKFYNNQEPDAVSKPSRFVTVWKKTNQTWQMTRIISLHK